MFSHILYKAAKFLVQNKRCVKFQSVFLAMDDYSDKLHEKFHLFISWSVEK